MTDSPNIYEYVDGHGDVLEVWLTIECADAPHGSLSFAVNDDTPAWLPPDEVRNLIAALERAVNP